MAYTEANYENAVIEVFRDTLGYDYVYGPDMTRDHNEPLYMDELLPSLRRVNPKLPESALTEAVYKLRNIESGTVFQKNFLFMEYLQNGISVNFFDKGKPRADLVRLVDFENINRNTFTVANQWEVVENSRKRPDVIVFLNGLPIVVFELKSPSREETDTSEAFRQLRNYMIEIPSLFTYNAFCAMSDLAISKAGTITADEDRFMEWKTKDGNYENTQHAQFDTFIEGMFDKARLLDIIQNFICFSADVKILGAYHQYFAVKKAVASTVKAINTDGKGGVFWHTQGSGKSLSMVFYAHLLQQVLHSPTIVVLTDRNDLDDQLFAQFAMCADFIRQTPQQAENRSHLKELLAGRQANGIIFTTAQKFEESSECLSERRNIIVIADEAHRSQFIHERIDSKTGRVKKTFGLLIRESLPNATYIGFTGTPISSKDRSTNEVFGNYIDIYDMTQSVEDGATRPVYYESRVLNLKLDEDLLRKIDAEYDLMAQNAEEHAIEKSKKELGNLESILGADQTITALCQDIIRHYEENRQYELTGKAMIVGYSRTIAMSIYRKLIEFRPEWVEKVGVVMTEDNRDPEEWRRVIGNKRHRNEMAKRFKDNDDPLKIAIVVDMWLTGFDVPSLATMYIYKPMSGHNLMQAIARVNRVYKDKEGGLVVDYVGIASALKQAMNDYTNRDKNNYGNTDIAETALPKFIEKLEVCRDLFHGFDYSGFMREDATDLSRAKAISGGVNFLTAIGAEIGYNGMSRKDVYIKEAMLLRQALSLCRSLLTPEQRYESAYFEAVRTLLTRITSESKPLSLKEINTRINDLLKASIQSQGVINLFSDVDTGFSLFDPKFLDGISKMKEKNLSLELLKKLLSEQVSQYRKTNLVKSEKFSDRLSRAMKSYINGMLSNEEVIAELMKMAKDMANAQEKGDAMGLDDEELAFYDALTRPEAVKDVYQNEELVAMTRELAEKLRKNRNIDWQKKESARAGMRRIVKKLLKKYKYPPDGMEDALETVIGQCEMWADH
ncbi:type I restriction endonuclease subunit R [Thermoactinomyces sp. DSM 45892]|uniref:type I restriction endonuclease subunit R n=1 Tax=Thermoactinomyces sp. DSM 45892 TaxID=1882753 RepID=UPI00089931F5|nr:type I restriction endonuclease subunit R [Thermoactinomyces sp. DSM 45892]SDY24205.1 type I restriction enzyme, R subunit [Thermoactinomyces sp. DSM 45892]